MNHITVDVKGEILQLKETMNTMVDQLSAFASEVTRVAREVGTEGKLGGQATVPCVAGTWKDLTDNVTRLVDDLLDVARLRKDGLQLNCARIDVCVVVARAMRAVEYVMQQREHRMTVSYPKQELWLRGDEARLEQVFVNLLLNSAKYTDVGGDICLSINREGDEAVIAVRDTGIGIAANVLPRVFDLYVQGNPSSRDGGLGLGLPLVRALVESHGGRVTAASEGIGRGSEFCVRLPAFT